MIDKETRLKVLKDLAMSSNGVALKEYIDEKIKEMSDITKITAEELEATKKAVVVLKEIFSFLDRLKAEDKKQKNYSYN